MAVEPWGSRELWLLARAGDRSALGSLLPSLLPRIRRAVYRLCAFSADVDDVSQEVFVRLIQSVPRLSDPANARAFVLGIAANVVREQSRTRRLEPTPSDAVDGAQAMEDPSADADTRETERRLREELVAMPPLLREAFALSFYEGLEPAEIAEILGVEAGTVRHRLFRARAKLRDVFARPGTRSRR